MALWALAPATRSPANMAISLAGLLAAILWTRWLGMLRPRSWSKAFVEGVLLYAGAVGLANVLLLTIGTAPWAAAAP